MGSGYASLLAGYTSQDGAFGRLEAGWHPLAPVTLYGQAEASSELGVMAGLGARVTW